jgi:hypothetical protein
VQNSRSTARPNASALKWLDLNTYFQHRDECSGMSVIPHEQESETVQQLNPA